MAKFNSTVVTSAGIALLQKAQYGAFALTFTKIEVGDGIYTGGENLKEATELLSQKQGFPVSSFTAISDEAVKITAVMSNVELGESYYIREIGLYAQDPDDGPILYAITTAAENGADYYPAYDGHYPVTITVELYVTVSDSANVTVEGGSGAYASAKDVEEFKESVKSGDIVIGFESKDTENSDAWEDVPVIEGGEKHKSILWKLSTMARNVRYLFKVLGSTDISKVQDGTVTGTIAALHALAFSGKYSDISGTPSSLPANGGDASTVGGKSPSVLQDYNNLSNRPTIPTVNNAKLIINQNGTKKGEFTANQSGNDVVVNLTDTNTDTNTTYSAGTGLTLTGTQFAVKIVNNETTTDATYLLAAPAGKRLRDLINSKQNKLTTREWTTSPLTLGSDQQAWSIPGIALSGYTVLGIARQWVINAPSGGVGSSSCILNVYTLTASSVGGQILSCVNSAKVIIHVVVLYAADDLFV